MSEERAGAGGKQQSWTAAPHLLSQWDLRFCLQTRHHASRKKYWRRTGATEVMEGMLSRAATEERPPEEQAGRRKGWGLRSGPGGRGVQGAAVVTSPGQEGHEAAAAGGART